MAKRRPRAAAVAQPARVRRRSVLDTHETAILFGVLVFLLGGYWDVAWHIAVGRESFWSPPHLVLYGGILLILAACAHAFVRAWRSGRKVPGVGPLIAALGAALSLASAPIDDLWHWLYGLDVTILSPPHVLLIAGMAIAAFGAMAGFALRANRRDPARLAALWRSTGGRWPTGGDEAGILVASGVLLAIALAVLGEYDFDVARYPVTWHPVLLGTLAAFVLALAAHASGRVGAATLAAAAYTGVRLLAQLELWAFGNPLPQIPLVLPAALAMDLALWQLSLRSRTDLPQRSDGRLKASGFGPRTSDFGPPLAGGAAFAALLLLVEWPYTTAWNAVVWSPDVLAVAAAPAVLGAAVTTALGWLVGGALRPVNAAAAPAGRLLAGSGLAGDKPPRYSLPSGTQHAPRTTQHPARSTHHARAAVWNGWGQAPGLAIIAATLGLAVFAVAPAIRRAGAPPGASFTMPAHPQTIGYVEFSPAVPVVGQPLTLRVTLDDPAPLGAAVAIPYETVRAGDAARGAMQTAGQPGVYQATITPRQAGRRWVSVFLEGEEGRVAASASFAVYRPQDAASRQPLPARFLVVRPEPGPQLDAPPWLTPLVYAGIVALVAVVVVAIAWALRRATQLALPAIPASPVTAPPPPAGRKAPVRPAVRARV